jgi:chemotaxis protein MotB
MFAIGSSELQPYTREILREIGKVMNDVENRITISGHTDHSPYSGGEKGYSNWELSADRANAARRVLLSGGMEEHRIARVVGLGSAVLLDPSDPFSAINRRVSIILMNRRAEKAAKTDGGTIEVEDLGKSGKSAEVSESGTKPISLPAKAISSAGTKEEHGSGSGKSH